MKIKLARWLSGGIPPVLPLLMAGTLLALFATVALSLNQAIYYYNPEINVNNYASLKVEFDKNLRVAGGYEFQPFSEIDTFEKFISEKKSGLLLLSSWHFTLLRKKLAIEPLLVGRVGDKSTYRKVLVGNKSMTNLEKLRGATIATAGSKRFSRNMLKAMLGEENSDIADSVIFLVAPKDIDALLAMQFGLAQAALGSEMALNAVGEINNRFRDSINILLKSDELLLQIVAGFGQQGLNEKVMISIMEKFGGSKEGGNALQMIGLDGFTKIGKTEMDILDR